MNINNTPVSELKKIIDAANIESWESLDVITLVLELGIEASQISLDKVSMLQVLQHNPGIFYNDVMFFIHAVAVCNNKAADFDYVFIPNSLEVGFAITDIAKIYPGVIGDDVKVLLKKILTDEGYSRVPACYGTNIDLAEGQLASDINDKEMAMKAYIHFMYKESK